MRVAIDAVGRIVVPKPVREQLGVSGPTELELTVADGRLELSIVDLPARVEGHEGAATIVTDTSPPPLDQRSVRAAIDSVRR